MTTIEIPDNLQIVGRGCLIHAQAVRYKKDLKAESNAKEISDALPFLEYDLQRLLVNKLKAKGMNAIFGMRITISIGEKMMALIGTGTGVYLVCISFGIVRNHVESCNVQPITVFLASLCLHSRLCHHQISQKLCKAIHGQTPTKLSS